MATAMTWQKWIPFLTKRCHRVAVSQLHAETACFVVQEEITGEGETTWIINEH